MRHLSGEIKSCSKKLFSQRFTEKDNVKFVAIFEVVIILSRLKLQEILLN